MMAVRPRFINITRLSSILRALRASSTISAQPPIDSSPLFSYTSGRWLWNEKEQLEARYRHFDIPSLQQIACQALDAHRCLSVEKIGEGNYNKAYRLTMGDGRRVIAKIPHPNAGPPVLTTSSEVATMEFIRTVLQIPVPKVLAWSANNENPVHAEYIIMEEATGTQLHKIWGDLRLQAKLDIIHEAVEVERKLLSVSFNKIGCLYFNDSTVPNCVPITGTVDSQAFTASVRSRFCIGPIVRREFWENERSQMHHYHGPWNSSLHYLESVIDREIDWIKAYAKPRAAADHLWQFESPEQQSPEAHLTCLNRLRSALPYIVPQDPAISSPRIWHPDFHAGNIYVDNQGRITSIIDWQGTWTTPLFIGVNPPALLDYGVDMLMKLPDNFKSLDDITKDRLRYQVSQSILIHSYESLTRQKNPLMHKMMQHPHGQTLKRLEAFAGSTWDNCLFPLQECLMQVEREWEHFGCDEPCPFHFSDEEIRKHHQEVDNFNASQQFWEGMRGILTDEGYTSNETFEDAVKILAELRSETAVSRHSSNGD